MLSHINPQAFIEHQHGIVFIIPLYQMIFFLISSQFPEDDGKKRLTPPFLETIRVYFNQHRVQMKCHAL